MTDYRKLSIVEKRTHAIGVQREPSVRCPRCDAQLLPGELAEHQAMRCTGERPTPTPRARWLDRKEALNYVAAPVLDQWCERGLVRVHADRYLERDLSIATAWARTLECL